MVLNYHLCISASFEEYTKIEKILFFCSFSDFGREITEKGLKLTKKVENGSKKYFEQLSGARITQKLVEMHNNHFYRYRFLC